MNKNEILRNEIPNHNDSTISDQIDMVLKLVDCMPRYRWIKICNTINRLYESKANKTKLADLESVKNELKLELMP